ncbi:MAG: hypothetical protein EOP88_00095 [Verrucomicrobiaceae bacterium]|nr:MAG: hypothetical protein EOP88_00095 [Verrucomicrobiaceae bacterium]
MSFVLHFIFGLIVGAVLGYASSGRASGLLLPGDLILSWISGTALIGAGLGAKLGDRLWMASSESMVGSDGPSHSRFSAWLCHLSIFSGVVFAATALFKHFYR